MFDRTKTVEENARENAELRAKIEAFLADADAKVYEFPTTLTNVQRYKVHYLADHEFRVGHRSEGEGSARRIILTKGDLKPYHASAHTAPVRQPRTGAAGATTGGSDPALPPARLQRIPRGPAGAAGFTSATDTAEADAPAADASTAPADAGAPSADAGAPPADAGAPPAGSDLPLAGQLADEAAAHVAAPDA